MTREISSRDLDMIAAATRLAYQYDPAPFLIMGARSYALMLETLRIRWSMLMLASAYLFAAASTGYWWLGLPCLPLSLFGAVCARRHRASRLRWSVPVVEEVGSRWLQEQSHPNAAGIPGTGE